MKNIFISLFELFSPMLLVLGTLGLFFPATMSAGFVLLSVGCVLGLGAFAAKRNIDIYERFHVLACIAGIISLGLFAFTGAIYTLQVALIVLFTVDFLIIIMDLKNGPEQKEKKPAPREKNEKYEEFQEKKISDELDNIRDEFSHIQIYEAGEPEDIEDLSLKAQAAEIKQELEKAVVVEDPKEGRYFYKENAASFHLKGCSTIKSVPRKDLKSSNSRTALLAKGYKACKVCNA